MNRDRTKGHDEGATLRLFLARQMLGEALQSADDPALLSRMRLLCLTDRSVELVLLALLPLLGVAVHPRPDFPRMMADLCCCRPALQCHAPRIAWMHRLRKRMQQDGIVPSRGDARQAVADAECFIVAAVGAVTGEEIHELWAGRENVL